MPARRFTVGHKGVSRISLFERTDIASPSLYIEWWDDDGRHKAALSSVVGHPVTDWELGKQIAVRMSQAQEAKRNAQATELLGLPVARTLSELLERRHADLGPGWTVKYAKSRDRAKAFWLERIGDVKLTAVNAAIVERVAKRAQAELGRSDRWRQDLLRYLVDSFIYAERKLKWIESRHNLSAVEIPTAKGKSRAYTLDEAQKILPALWDVHPTAGWIGVVAFQTGRRLSAIRLLTPDAVRVVGEYTHIEFPGETDKARNTGTAAVYGLPERTDWSIPSEDDCNDWMHEAEQIAGVRHINGRAWHGLKRLYATLTEKMPGADKQSGTRQDTLELLYRQDVLGPKEELARQLHQIGTDDRAGTV